MNSINFSSYKFSASALPKDIKLVNNFDNAIELNSNNFIDLEKMDEKERIKENLKQNINSQIEKVNTVITTEEFNDILVNLEIIDKPIDRIENTGEITEAEKNRFNVKYELYEGENIDLESVKRLIDTAKNDLENVKITSYKEKPNNKGEKVPNGYKLIIASNNQNEQLANVLLEKLKENNDKSFTVKIEYNENTKLVESILLNVNE